MFGCENKTSVTEEDRHGMALVLTGGTRQDYSCVVQLESNPFERLVILLKHIPQSGKHQ